MGELKQAKQHLEKALALKPGYADAKTNLAAVNEALKAQPVPGGKPAAVRKAAPGKKLTAAGRARAQRGAVTQRKAPGKKRRSRR